MPGEMRAIVRGVDIAEAALARMERQIDVASLKALKSCQALAKKYVKSGMRGRPRWDHRGKNPARGLRGVSLNLTPHHVSKGGGPGQLTGALFKGVGGVRKPKIDPLTGTVAGGVGAGGEVQNNYKRQVEAQYPYLQPGVAKAQPQMGAVWAAAWERATSKWD
jgi:hypothetical protein